MDNQNHSAFPVTTQSFGYAMSGLTKRELIAAMLMQGYFSSQTDEYPILPKNFEYIAEHSIRAADALLIELEKQK